MSHATTEESSYKTHIEQALTETLYALWQRWGKPQPPPTSKRAFEDALKTQPPSTKTTRQLKELLEQELPQTVLTQLKIIQQDHKTVNCHQCGVCCRLASHEDDYQTLLNKAEAGDTFAQEFTSVMLPYKNEAAAREAFPELVDEVKKTAGNRETYFYHCPYIQQDNKCGLWQNPTPGLPRRPTMCATYPETPLTWQQPNCAWGDWKAKHLNTAMACHAKLAVYEVLLTSLNTVN